MRKINNFLGKLSGRRNMMLVTALMMLSAGLLRGQTNIANYQFAKSSETYTPITGGTVLVVANALYDQDISSAVTIPAMNFGGTSVNTVYVHANGYITFGAAHSTTTYTPLSTTGTNVTGVVSAFAADLGFSAGNATAGATNEIRYQQIADEFVAQFSDVKRWNIANERISFQIRINSTTGIIKIIYGGTIVIGSSTTGLQVGIRGNSTTWASNVNNLMIDNIPSGTTCDWSNAVTGNASSAALYTTSANTAVAPVAGLTYTWTPATTPAPVRTFAAVTNIAANGATVSWTAPTGATQYNVQYRVPGTCAWTNYSGNPVTGPTVTLTGLSPTTTYQVRVMSNDGTNNAIWSHIPNAAGTGNGYSTSGTFTTTATCGIPTSVTVPAASINSTTATVNWTAPTIGPPTGYKWEVRTSGAAGSGPTGLTTTGTGTTTTANLTGLASATTYSVYVRTNCGASDSSLWTSAVTFTTLCTTPAPGATIASPSSGLCAGASVAFSLTTATPGPGVTYQWQSSADNVSYTNVSGATAATYTGPATAFYYRCMVKCAAGPDSTASTPVQLSYTNSISSTTVAQRCGTGTVNLSAAGNAGTTLNWYGAVTGGASLGTGTTFTTPTISNTTTYYVGAEVSSVVTAYGARTAPASTSNTTPSNYGLVFDVTTPFTLNSVDVYNAGSSGTMTIQLQNSAGTPLQTSSVFTVPTGTGTTPYTAALGWAIPAGTGYRILVTTGTASLVREGSLGGFPYAIGSVGSITSGYISGTSSTYYYLYNWNYTATITCSSPRTAVTATVNTPPAFSISPNRTICNGSIAPLSVTSNTSNFNTYTWSPVTNLYTDAAATVAYTAGSNATTVYLKSTAPGSVVYTASANNTTSLCAAIATDTMIVLPAAVTATATPASLCFSGAAMFSLTPASGYGAGHFQWQSSLNNTGFSNEGVGDTLMTYTSPTLTATKYYRVTLKDGAGNVCLNSASDTALVNTPTITGTTPASRCGTGTVTLAAAANTGSTPIWYAAQTGGSSLATGNTFTTPSISANTNYWVSARSTGMGGAGTAVMDTGTTLTTTTEELTAFCNRRVSYKMQMIFTATELNAAGIYGGNITSIGFNITTIGDAATNANYTVKMGTTGQSAATATYITTGLNTVYGPSTYTHAVGQNTITFANPFPWDGSSNVVVEITHDGIDALYNATTYYTTKTNSMTGYSYNGTAAATTSTKRLNTYFGYVSYCESPRQQITATVNANPTAGIAPTGTVQICSGNTTTLTGSGGGNYQWRNATGNIAGQTNSTFTTGTAGTYRVVVTTPATGCTDTSAFVTVNVNPAPNVFLGNDTTFCSGPTLTLNAGNTGATFLWDNASTNQARAVNTTGSYYVKVTNAANCSKSDTIQVTVNPTPVVNLGNDTSLCQGANLVLNAANPGAARLWDNGTTAQTRTVNATGTYYVRVTNSFNCVARDTITASFLPSPTVNLGNDIEACAGNTITLNAGNPGETYRWDNNSTQQTRSVTNSGTYYVTVSNSANCKGSDTVNVTIHPLPVVKLGNDTTICHDITLLLDAGNPGASYHWNNNATTQTLPVAATGNYSVVVTDGFGCVGSDDINVQVTPLPNGIINAVHGDTATYTFNMLNQQSITGYTWNFGDGSPLVNGALVQHRYMNNGIYTVSVMLAGACNDSALVSRTVDVYDATGSTGIKQLNDSKEIALYPNPAKDIVTIENRKGLDLKQVSVYNTIGQLVYSAAADSKDKHQMHTGGLASGIYTMRIETSQGFVIRKFEIRK